MDEEQERRKRLLERWPNVTMGDLKDYTMGDLAWAAAEYERLKEQGNGNTNHQS